MVAVSPSCRQTWHGLVVGRGGVLPESVTGLLSVGVLSEPLRRRRLQCTHCVSRQGTSCSCPHPESVRDEPFCIHHTTSFSQALTQDSSMPFVSCSTRHAMHAIGTTKTAIVHLDTISSTYLQPLHAFNTVVTGIANVRVQNTDLLFRSTIMHRSTHTPKWRWLH